MLASTNPRAQGSCVATTGNRLDRGSEGCLSALGTRTAPNGPQRAAQARSRVAQPTGGQDAAEARPLPTVGPLACPARLRVCRLLLCLLVLSNDGVRDATLCVDLNSVLLSPSTNLGRVGTGALCRNAGLPGGWARGLCYLTSDIHEIEEGIEKLFPALWAEVNLIGNVVPLGFKASFSCAIPCLIEYAVMKLGLTRVVDAKSLHVFSRFAVKVIDDSYQKICFDVANAGNIGDYFLNTRLSGMVTGYRLCLSCHIGPLGLVGARSLSASTDSAPPREGPSAFI
ncbi:hypothetical protein M2155_001840 [Streptomyces sp. SAI-119]|nr:hypothetical protein [Streptomyces sp. SAI-119]